MKIDDPHKLEEIVRSLINDGWDQGGIEVAAMCEKLKGLHTKSLGCRKKRAALSRYLSSTEKGET